MNIYIQLLEAEVMRLRGKVYELESKIVELDPIKKALRESGKKLEKQLLGYEKTKKEET